MRHTHGMKNRRKSLVENVWEGVVSLALRRIPCPLQAHSRLVAVCGRLLILMHPDASLW